MGGMRNRQTSGKVLLSNFHFRQLNIRSGPELDALVEQAQQTITGIEPQTLRDSNRLRQMVARDFEQIQASVGEMLVDRPRRNILRRGVVGGAV